MFKKVLLLNNDNSVLGIIQFKKAIRLYFKGKVEVISTWNNIRLTSSSLSIDYPAILKMNYYVRRKYLKPVFSRKAVLKRDNYTCQFCGKCLKNNNPTIDHIVPTALGGKGSFFNCVAACQLCNSKKGKRTLEETGMKLLSKPSVPTKFSMAIHENDEDIHPDWSVYINKDF